MTIDVHAADRGGRVPAALDARGRRGLHRRAAGTADASWRRETAVARPRCDRRVHSSATAPGYSASGPAPARSTPERAVASSREPDARRPPRRRRGDAAASGRRASDLRRPPTAPRAAPSAAAAAAATRPRRRVLDPVAFSARSAAALSRGLDLPGRARAGGPVLPAPGRADRRADRRPPARRVRAGRVGLRRGVRRAGLSVLRVHVRALVASDGDGRRERAGARPRDARRQPCRRAALGRDDDERRDPQAPPAAAPPALHGARLGLPAAVGEQLHAPRRRRRRLALQRDAPAASRGTW